MKFKLTISKIFVVVFSLSMFSNMVMAKDYSILQWNIWQEGTKVPGGYEAVVAEIHRLQPDFVALSEVRNYKGVDFMKRLVDDLAALGDTYYTAPSYDTGLLSRYPIESFDTVFPENGDHGSIHRLRTTTDVGDKLSVATAHLDYLDCAYYEVRGYSGTSWKECEIPGSVEEVLRKNDLSQRDDAIRQFLAVAEKDISDGYSVFIGGDFNEPSYADWQEDTSDLRDHAGLVVPWTVSVLMRDAGFIDSYRHVYPDAVAYPGFTFPSGNPDVETKRLTWAPKSDERERIDFICFKPASGIEVEVTAANVFGPEESICRSEYVKDEGCEDYILPSGLWPTDHKGLMVRFQIGPK